MGKHLGDVNKQGVNPEAGMKKEAGQSLRFAAPSHSRASVSLIEEEGWGPTNSVPTGTTGTSLRSE